MDTLFVDKDTVENVFRIEKNEDDFTITIITGCRRVVLYFDQSYTASHVPFGGERKIDGWFKIIRRLDRGSIVDFRSDDEFDWPMIESVSVEDKE